MSLTETLSGYLEDQFRNQGDEISLQPDDDLVELGFDSIAYVRLVAFIKKTYGVAVPDHDLTLAQFGTLGRIVDYLSAKGVEDA